MHNYYVYDAAFIAMLKGICIFSAKNPDESELDEALNNVVSNITWLYYSRIPYSLIDKHMHLSLSVVKIYAPIR